MSKTLGSLLVVVALSALASSVVQGQGAGAPPAEAKTTYIVFFREWDAAAQEMAQVVKASADKHAAKATWGGVNITDPAQKATVDKYQVSRAPMPLVLAVHPNGAVTGFFAKRMGETDLARCLVSPKQAECMKALQQNQLVLLCVQPLGKQDLPQGVRDFQADPMFAKRTQVVLVQQNDAGETGFFADLKVDATAQDTVTVFMAPPGVMVGRFAANASKSDLAKALHAAGKCCDDKNCNHKH